MVKGGIRTHAWQVKGTGWWDQEGSWGWWKRDTDLKCMYVNTYSLRNNQELVLHIVTEQ